MPSLRIRSQTSNSINPSPISANRHTTKPSNLITREWLARPSVEVAPELVGCYLVRRLEDGTHWRGLIVEVEAYNQKDPACHGHRGKSARNEVMFGPAGHAYVYFIYGMYHCVNVVTGHAGEADGVLIRALHFEEICDKRYSELSQKQKARLAAGPGKICRLLHIDRSLCGSQYHPDSGLWLERSSLKETKLVQTTRVGLSKGAELPWRWYIKDHPSVSVLRR